MSKGHSSGRAAKQPLPGREGRNNGRRRRYLPMLPKTQRAHWDDEKPHMLPPPPTGRRGHWPWPLTADAAEDAGGRQAAICVCE